MGWGHLQGAVHMMAARLIKLLSCISTVEAVCLFVGSGAASSSLESVSLV